MYTPKYFSEENTEVLHDFIRSFPLATLIANPDSEIVVNHLPLILKFDSQDRASLQGHMPRSNTIWKSFDGETETVAVFQGPSAYISPSWYASKSEHGRVVPTWNYAVVHARGRPIAIEDDQWLLRHLKELTGQQESGFSSPWQVTDAPEDYVEKNIRRIVGFDMPVTSLKGKRKYSQNQSAQDREGVANALGASDDSDARAIAAYIRAGLGSHSEC